ncbi:MAG: NapC/NirT family cytochrome c [Acidobacteriota bacterium]
MNLLLKPFKALAKLIHLFRRNIVSLHKLIWGSGWKKLILAFVVTIIVLLVLGSFTLEVTSRPGFCSTCHFMKPYYESWVNSSHKNVTCTDCHFPPGLKNKLKGKMTAASMVVNYFTGVYKKSKPWAEISDASCLRSGCHETRNLKGKVKFKKNIDFDHAPHLEGLRREKQLRCTSCHSQIVQGSHLSVTETSCFLCHFKGIEGEIEVISKCIKCHTPPVKGENNSDEIKYDHSNILTRKISCYKCHGKMVVGDGAVPRNRCNNCHAEQGKIDLYDDTELMHKNHITDHKIECIQCHTEIQHKSVARTEEIIPECSSCHTDPHKLQLMMFTGKGGRNVPDHPSSMFESGLNCKACHQHHNFSVSLVEKGDTLVANGQSCEPCHGKGYNKILMNWKNQTEKKISQLKRIFPLIKKEIETIVDKSRKRRSEQIYKDAEFNFNMVKFGNSIHNISFANKLLDQSYKMLLKSLGEKGEQVTIPGFDLETNIVPGECSNCHSGIELRTAKIFGWDFPHSKHLNGKELTCRKCHSNKAVHGQLMLKKGDCMDCHHKKKSKKNCTDCHQVQKDIYEGKLEHLTLNIPNVMVNDVECSDCHISGNDEIIRPSKKKCSYCHEEDYEAMYEEWFSSTAELMERLKKKVEKEKLESGNRAYDIYKLLLKDGSKGIHNPELYEKLISDLLH